MGQSPLRVKTEVKFIFFLSPEGVGRQSSRDEEEAASLIADRKGDLLLTIRDVCNNENQDGKQ